LTAAAVCPGCENEQTDVFAVQGLCCAAEVALVEGGLAKLPGVCSVRASAVTGKATVVHTLERGAVEQALAGIGFRARAAESDAVEPMSTGYQAPAHESQRPHGAAVSSSRERCRNSMRHSSVRSYSIMWSCSAVRAAAIRSYRGAS